MRFFVFKWNAAAPWCPRGGGWVVVGGGAGGAQITVSELSGTTTRQQLSPNTSLLPILKPVRDPQRGPDLTCGLLLLSFDEEQWSACDHCD